MQFESTAEFAHHLDEVDPLRSYRSKFLIPVVNNKEQIYFLGNSLGLQPVNTRSGLTEVLDQWAQYGVEGFFWEDKPWYHYHDQITPLLSKIVGALPSEVVAMNQLTVNLHLMMASFYQPKGKRKKILCEDKAFPSDQYMLETFCRFINEDPAEILIEVGPRAGEYITRMEDILEAISTHGEELALVFWSGVNYYTGQLFDVHAITSAAQSVGAKAGFDLAHAAGNVPLKLHSWNVDFACWCSYKYLNSGPGGVGNAFVHERYHADPSLKRLAGWWGYNKETRFKMEKGFQPVPTAEGWQLSTPSILLYAAHKVALEIFDEAGMDAIRKKSVLLSDFLLFLLEDLKLEIITPKDTSMRGSQISMLVPENGREVFEKLGKSGIFADWREPNVIRVAPAPLYNTFSEVWRFAKVLNTLI